MTIPLQERLLASLTSDEGVRTLLYILEPHTSVGAIQTGKYPGLYVLQFNVRGEIEEDIYSLDDIEVWRSIFWNLSRLDVSMEVPQCE